MSEESAVAVAEAPQASPEVATQEATVATQEASREITWENSPIAKVYNPDGTPKSEAAKALAELGKDDLAGYALRNGQDFFTALKTGKDAAAYASQKQEGMVKLPGEDATDEDRAAFNKALGALEKPEDYAANMWPDDLPEGFQKDEKLAGIFAAHAAKNPVATAESVKGLVSEVIAYQQEQQTAMMEDYAKQAEEAATKTREALTIEMGGTSKYEEFSKSMKEAITSREFSELGFEFFRNEDGTVTSHNPLHTAMLSDPAILRLLKDRMDATRPAAIPGQAPMTVSGETREEQARAYYEKHGVGGFKSTKHLEEYNRLRGITR